MDKNQVRSIIEATLKSGGKTPGLFDLPRVLSLKGQLESCSTIPEVLDLLESHRPLVCKAFGLDAARFDDGLRRLRELA